MSKLKSPVNKETFKIALSECIKKAWIWSNKVNFEHAIKWYKEHQLTFDIGTELQDESEFNDSAVSIDLFDAYLNIDSLDENEALEFSKQWEKIWESADGFNLGTFKGESIEDGLEFGIKVQEYFDMLNIFENKSNNTNFKTLDLSPFRFIEAEEKTKLALENLDNKYIYEASFSHDDQKLRTKCDVLKIKPNKHVEIYEAKATTKVKVEHFYDLMYQVYVLEKNGFIVDNIFIVRINSEYVKGWNYNQIPLNTSFGNFAKLNESSYPPVEYEDIKELVESDFIVPSNDELIDLDLQALILVDELTWGKAQNRNTLMEDLNTFKSQMNLDFIFDHISNYLAIESNNGVIPEFLLAKQCMGKVAKSRSQDFSFFASNDESACCFHVMKWFDKNEPGFWNILKFYKKSKADVILHSPSPYFKDYDSLFDFSIQLNKKGSSYFNNNAKALRMFEVYKAQQKNPLNKKNWQIINSNSIDKVKELLSEYKKYPIYMYDFETSKWAIPKFNKTNSYYQVPFQYSIDVIVDDKYDYNNPNSMFHYDFLSNEIGVDPRPKFIENFIKDCFKHGPGIYVAYSDSFERGVLRKLALLFPEYAKPLFYIIEHTIDLMHFFYGNSKDDRPFFLVYHPNFLGSYSIKKTQPSLDDSFSYNDLIINKGDKASETFRNFVDNNIPIEAWNLKIKDGMFKYCNRDTLAMVVILKKIEELVSELYE